MPLSGKSFDPGRPPASAAPVVDYTLARRSVLGALRRGLIGTTDVCDAHPELLRAARNIGLEDPRGCPICSHDTLKNVRYVYGEELKRDNGRVVYPDEWLAELASKHDQFTCYVVEVCIDCSWNHLVRSYSAGRRFRALRDTGRSRAT